MADTFKKIFDTSISMTDVEQGGEVTVLTTDANTSVVIKDVKTKGGDTSVFTGVDLTLDGYEIASGISADNGAASGTQIIPPSSTVKAKLSNSTALAEYDIIKYASTYTDFTWDISEIVLQTGEVLSTESVAFNSGYVNLDFTRVYPYDRTDGEKRYILFESNGDNVQELRIVDSSGTLIKFVEVDYNGFAYSGNRYVYYTYSSNLFKYDLETDTETAIASPVPINGSYLRMGHCKNGSYEYLVGYQGTTYGSFFVYDVTNDVLTTSISLSNIQTASSFYNFEVMALSDGKIIVTDNSWFDNTTYNSLPDYAVIDPLNSYTVSLHTNQITFNGHMASLGAANYQYVYGGYKFHPDGRVFVRGVDSNNGGVLYSTVWSFNTPSDPTSGIFIDFTSSSATSYDVPVGYVATNTYGKHTLSLAFNSVDNTAETFDIAAFGIESV